MNPLKSLGMLRSVSNLAHETLGGVASRIGAAATSQASGDFAAMLQQSSQPAPPSIADMRDNLMRQVESLLQRMGIQPNPAIELQVNEAGRVQLDVDHPQAAELEANLNQESAIQEIAAQLAQFADSADRRFVIHAIPQAH